MSARESQRVSRERQALAQALGSADAESVDRLYANGLRASTAEAVEWLPAVEVAWSDQRVAQNILKTGPVQVGHSAGRVSRGEMGGG